MKPTKIISIILSFVLLSIISCREIELVVPTEYELLPFDIQPNANPMGMYQLNEGNMGSNKASIDYLDFQKLITYVIYMPNVIQVSSKNWAM